MTLIYQLVRLGMKSRVLFKKKLKERWQKQWRRRRRKKKTMFFTKFKWKWERGEVQENRRKEIIISRIRLGHTRLNSTLYKMGKQYGKV